MGQLLDVELHIHPLNAENVVKILDAAITTKAMPSRQKLLFSQRKIEFLEDFGPNVSCIQTAKDDHEKLTNEVKREAKTTKAILIDFQDLSLFFPSATTTTSLRLRELY